MSKKSHSFLYSDAVYKHGQDFLVTQHFVFIKHPHLILIRIFFKLGSGSKLHTKIDIVLFIIVIHLQMSNKLLYAEVDVRTELTYIDLYITVCPGSSDPLYIIISYYTVCQ